MLWPPVLLALFSSALSALHGDTWLADRLYAWEGGRWSLQSHWLIQDILHTGGRTASVLAWLGVVVAWVVSLSRSRWRKWRMPLGYLALAVLLGTGVVSALKLNSHAGCPWDLVRYGGSGAGGHCFPAGHASAGYAWLSLYFFVDAVKPAWRRYGLAAGVGSGLLFGIGQQLRGAHFLSHDLAAAMVCWSVALVLHLPMLRRRESLQ